MDGDKGKRATMGAGPMEWIRRKLDLASMSGALANMGAVMNLVLMQRRLIDGLRADLTATQEALAERNRQILDLQGEVMRIEHYLELYRSTTDSADRRRYELKPIPRSHRRRRGGRAR